jgi:hypothetical protein
MIDCPTDILLAEESVNAQYGYALLYFLFGLENAQHSSATAKPVTWHCHINAFCVISNLLSLV